MMIFKMLSKSEVQKMSSKARTEFESKIINQLLSDIYNEPLDECYAGPTIRAYSDLLEIADVYFNFLTPELQQEAIVERHFPSKLAMAHCRCLAAIQRRIFVESLFNC